MQKTLFFGDFFFNIQKRKRAGKVIFHLIANEPKLQISLIVSAKNRDSQKYRYCKRISIIIDEINFGFLKT